ncbi:nitroreductase family protein [Eubacterium aggregans]|uniref:nitroreductase family protein n=1 Tax=Eubacterium aggregans TaxID=81409 RepID=UPI003F38CBD1
MITDEPRAFDSTMAHYGKFSGVPNYIAMIGKKGKGLDECCGYTGEKIVLEAQSLGLNTCWLASTYKKIPEVLDIPPMKSWPLSSPLDTVKPRGWPIPKRRPARCARTIPMSPNGLKME